MNFGDDVGGDVLGTTEVGQSLAELAGVGGDVLWTSEVGQSLAETAGPPTKKPRKSKPITDVADRAS